MLRLARKTEIQRKDARAIGKTRDTARQVDIEVQPLANRPHMAPSTILNTAQRRPTKVGFPLRYSEDGSSRPLKGGLTVHLAPPQVLQQGAQSKPSSSRMG